jgi:hypothetical protein
LERTGPFVPPISLPGINDIIVTEAFGHELAESGLLGLQRRPVIKKLIVKSDWHTWDQNAEQPAEYPEGDEPEGYILGQPHSPEASSDMGPLWEVLLNESARVQRDKEICARKDIHLLINTWEGEDLFRARGVRYYIYATPCAKDWFEQNAGQWVTFQEALTK